MAPLMLLWLPILLSAVAVFIVSSLIHTVVGYHRSDFAKVPSEGEAMDAMRKFSIPPGDYLMPRPDSPGGMNAPDYLDKMNKGPVMMMRVLPGGPIRMGGIFIQWFLFLIVVSAVSAYVAIHVLQRGAQPPTVFLSVGITAFASYALGSWPESIWYQRKWSTTVKNTIDGLIYGLVTGGIFCWLWPK